MSKFLKLGNFIENSNPYVKAATTIMKGVSFFKNRSAERKRLKKLGEDYAGDLGEFTGDIIPEIKQKYAQQADYYSAQGDLATASIYQRGIQQLDSGGQANLKFGGGDVAKGQATSAMDMMIQQRAASAQAQQRQNQEALSNELDTTQMQIDEMGNEYGKQGLVVDEYNIDDNLKYV